MSALASPAPAGGRVAMVAGTVDRAAAPPGHTVPGRPRGTPTRTPLPPAPGDAPVVVAPSSVRWLDPPGGAAADAAWALFDGDARTGLPAPEAGPLRIEVAFAEPIWLDQVTGAGRTRGTLSVLAGEPGAERPVAGLDARALAASGLFGPFRAKAPVLTRRAVVEWRPAGGGELGELALWSARDPVTLFPEADWASRVATGSFPGALNVASPRASARVGEPGARDEQSFEIELSAEPRSLAHAFLVYELEGVSHLTAVPRSINGRTGPAPAPAMAVTGRARLQIEEIDPGRLRRGVNRIAFGALIAGGRTSALPYRVSAVRVLGIPHGGAYAAVAPSDLAGPGDRARARTTSWLAPFDQPSLPHSIGFRLAGRATGQLLVTSPAGAGKLTIPLRGLEPGWHRWDAAGVFGATSSLRFAATGDAPAAIGDLRAFGSPQPAPGGPALALVHPLHGECDGDGASIRGFARSPGPALSRLEVNDRAIAAPELGEDGAFQVAVHPATPDQPSRVMLRARFADGSAATRTVTLGRCGRAPATAALTPDDGAPYAAWVTPQQPATLSYGGAVLDLPAGSVVEPVRITIRPLPRDQATPADRGEVNVVPGSGSYQLGPAGLRFTQPIHLRLPYDRAALPDAARLRHISTIYYDAPVGIWRAVPKVREASDGVLVSETDHFTEFMNATLPAPDAPGVKNYTPEEMQGIDLGSPSAGVDLIQPPTGNSRRTTDLSYALHLPTGINGMAPNLALSYSSGRGDGWLGVGWDLALSAIEHDLRFGVPDYAGDQIQNDFPGALAGAVRYVMDGAQLTAIGGAAGGTRYERRIKTGFERILRLPVVGNPALQYWEVTDKTGLKSVFGQSENARLADPQHPERIFRWALERIEDRFGNRVLYRYTQDRQTMGGVVMPQIYPNKICYGAISLDTADDCEGTYNIRFRLDEASTRPDRAIDARPGFPTKTVHRLDAVDVLFGSTAIRSYHLRYREGAFRKSLLAAVGLSGSDGRELYAHDFDYTTVDMTNPFGPPQVWGTMKQQGGVRRDRGLSRTKGSSVGGGGGLGVDFVVIGASVSAGGMSGSNRIEVSPGEISGDGVLDFLSNGGEGSINLFPRSTLADHLLFKPVPNVSRDSLGFTETSGWTAGGGITILGGVAGLGGNIAHVEANDHTLLADINGDGFVDQVRASDGTIKYRPGFKDGFGPEADWGTFDDNAIVFANQDRVANQGGTHFLVDPLVRWRAPFAGSVELTGAVRKRAAGGDGVRVSIVQNETPIWTRDIAANDVTACAPSAGGGCNSGSPLVVPVAAGDDLFFRVSAIDDTRKDLVEWSPAIRYQGVAPGHEDDREVYGAFVYRTNLADDFRLVGMPKRPWIPSAPGEVEVTSQGVKAATPDDAVLNVYRAPSSATTLADAELVLSQPLAAGFEGPYSASRSGVRVGRDDVLFFELRSDSPIDPARVGWEPQVRYTRYSRADPATGTYVEGAVIGCGPDLTGTRVCTIENDPTPETPILEAFIVQSPEINHDIFFWEATTATAVEVAGLVLPGTLFKGATGAPVCALIQGVNKLHSKVCLGPAATGPVDLPAPTGVVPGQPIYFTLVSRSPITRVAGLPGAGQVSWAPTLNGASPAVNVRRTDPNFGDTDSPTATHDMMSGGYHRWSFGDYRGDRPFTESALVLASVTDDQSAFLFGAMARLGVRNSGGPAYKLRGQDTFVAAGLFSPGRTKAGQGFTGGASIDALRLSDTWSYGINANALAIDAGLGAADTTGEVDFIDMNGDRFPDLVTRDGVMFNTGVAGFTAKRSGQRFGEFRQVNQKSVRLKASVSLGGNDEKNQTVPDTDTRGHTRSIMSTSFSVGLDYAVSSANTELLDVNQDNLPDLVVFDPDAKTMRVRLNTGYGLTPEIPWEDPQSQMRGFGLLEDIVNTINFIGKPTGAYSHRLEDTGSLSAGVAVGGGFSVGIFGGGGHVGAGYVTSINRKGSELFDVNGDGLKDHVSRRAGDPFLLVRLNLGDRFDTETQWPLPRWPTGVENAINSLGATILARANDRSAGASSDTETLGFTHSRDYSATFDAKVCVFFVCASAYGFYNDTAGGSEVAWTDVDGDGLVDQIAKLDGDERLYVKLNQLGKANLLRAVHRPFGGELELGYERYGNEVADGAAPAVDLPGNDYALVSVNAFDGRGQTLAQSFDYADAGQQTGKFDRVERDDYGSSIVVTTRGAPGSTGDGSQLVARYLNQDFYRQRLTSDALERDGQGRPFTHQTFRYEDPTPGGTSVQAKPEPLVGSFYPAEVVRTTEWFEGQPVAGKSTSETRTWSFDHGGILTLSLAQDEGPDDDVFYQIDYETRGLDVTSPSDLYLARPSRIVARRGASGPILRDRRATYAAGTGALETFDNRVSGGRIPGSTATYVDAPATVTIVRNGNGTVQSLTDANGYRLSYGYDPTGIYQTSTTDSFGLASSSAPNYLFGGVDTVIDANGNGTRYDYDPFGRPVAVWGPNDFVADPGAQAAIVPTIVAAYGLQPGVTSGPFWASMGHKDVVRNAPDVPRSAHDYVETVAFIDGFERVIQTKKDLEKDFGDHTEIGFTVSGQIRFDERGRVRSEGQPIFSAAPAQALVDVAAVDPGATERSTSWIYDVAGRITRLTTPADVEDVGHSFVDSTTEYGFGVDSAGIPRFLTTVTDARGNQRIHHRDVMDRVVEVTERADGSDGPPIHTRYRFDPVGELLETRDARGNVTTAAYDTAGRMVSLNSPDMGLVEWRYDLVGNVRERQTARLRQLGQTITYDYDFDRLRRVSYPDGPPREFEYGGPGDGGDAGGNRSGRLAVERSEAGVRSFRYDRHGNITEREVTFNRLSQPDQNPHNVPYRYRISYEYDSFARLLKLRYPDLRNPDQQGPPPDVVSLGDPSREVLTYRYDAGGSLQSIFGLNTQVNDSRPDVSPNTIYLAHLGYDEFGQRVRLLAGNFIETHYAFKPRSRRLAGVSADEHDSFLREHGQPARAFQRLDYTYDPTGNLTELRNDAPFDPGMHPSVFIGTLQHDYQYDSLGRLVHARGTLQEEDMWRNRYSQDFAYDDIHNITRKTNQSFRQKADSDGVFSDQQMIRDQTYDAVYSYDGPRPHAVTRTVEQLADDRDTVNRDYEYDASGNQTRWTFRNHDQREIVWNAENLVREVHLDGHLRARTVYDGSGQRAATVRYLTGQEETAYLSQELTIRDGEVFSKHVFAGATQLASKVDSAWGNDPSTLYFHTDHLGTTQYASNEAQDLTQHDEYFPSGEVWNEETDPHYQQIRRFVFAGKELDVATGLMYFGARYYDGRESQFLSPDPALSDYITSDVGGGVKNPLNLSLFSYAWHSPTRLIDRTGMLPDIPGSEADQSTYAKLAAIPLPMLQLVLASPTLRPRTVQDAARAGTLTNFSSHPGSTFLGTVGEALVMNSLLNPGGNSLFGGISTVVIPQPVSAALPPGVAAAVGATLPDLLVTQVGGSVSTGLGFRVEQRVRWNNTIGPGGMTPTTIDMGARTVVSLWEVTVSSSFTDIEARALKVAGWARAAPGVKSVLALDRGAFYSLTPAEQGSIIRTVTGAGGYIALFRELKPTAIQDARAIAAQLATP